MKRDLRYTPTDCFETFPFPEIMEADELASLGERLKHCRKRGHEAFNVGLTDLYNRFHDPEHTSPEVTALREVHVAIDERVKALYGFHDINLEYGFHEVAYLPPEDRVRYTVSEKARLELLRRLAKLNRERYEAEQAAVQLPSKAKPAGGRKAKAPATEAAPLYDLPAPMTGSHDKGASAVLEVLRWSRRWFGKDEILRESGLTAAAWKPVIDSLVASGTVEKEGEKRGTRYRLKA